MPFTKAKMWAIISDQELLELMHNKKCTRILSYLLSSLLILRYLSGVVCAFFAAVAIVNYTTLRFHFQALAHGYC